MKSHAWLKIVSVIVLLLCMGLGIANRSGTATAQQPEPTTVSDETTELQDGGTANTSVSTEDDEETSNDMSILSVGTAFTYQGRLVDGDAPATGSYDFIFSLHTAETGGSQRGGTVARDNVAVADGFFTVTLDFGNSIGDARYLQIGVRSGSSTGAYTDLAPRQLLTPAPYAVSAENANQLDGLSSDSFLQKRIATQFQSTLAPGETGTWTTWGWSPDEIVTWSVYPTSPGGRVGWSVETELERSDGPGNGLITYIINVTNTGSGTTDFEARYSVFR